MEHSNTVLIISTSVTAAAMILVAIYSRLTYCLSKKQDTRYSNPDIRVYEYNRKFYPDSKKNHYSILIVNPGEVPIIVTRVMEMTTEGVQLNELTEWCIAPDEEMAPSGIYMDTLPWAIQKGNYAICSRHLKEIPEESIITSQLRIRVEYEAGEDKRQKSKEILVDIQP